MSTIPPSWSKQEVCEAWDLNPRKLDALVRDGRVGFYRAKGGARRFFEEHLRQIRSELEVRPQASDDGFAIPGQSTRSAARHRKTA